MGSSKPAQGSQGQEKNHKGLACSFSGKGAEQGGRIYDSAAEFLKGIIRLLLGSWFHGHVPRTQHREAHAGLEADNSDEGGRHGPRTSPANEGTRHWGRSSLQVGRWHVGEFKAT